MDRIDAMRTFVTVVNEGAFARAAERLDMSPQLASKYVSQLEQHLGVRLLNRTTRRINLTEAGTRYFQRASQLLDDIDDLENQLGDLQEDVRGMLKINAPVSFATSHLAPLVCDFQKAYPGVGIDLQLNDRKVDIVEEGVDIALRIGRLKSSSLIARRLAPIRLAMCASPDYLQQHGHPTTLEQLQQHRYLKYSYLDAIDSEPAHHHLMQGRNACADLISNNGDVLSQAAIAGAGIAIQPTFICGQDILDGKLVQVMPEHPLQPLGLYAVYAHRQLLPGKVRCFIEFASDYFGEWPYWDAFTRPAQTGSESPSGSDQ